MKGLQKYIRKHGKHFTEELASKAIPNKWNSEQIRRAIDRKVWYNVTSSTMGDIVFLVNLAGCFHVFIPCNTKNKCINYALSIIGNMEYTDMAFSDWIDAMVKEGDSFDFSEYV